MEKNWQCWFQAESSRKIVLVLESNLDKDCSKDDTVQYLSDSNVKTECVDLKTKYDTYKSFKVVVNSEITPNLFSADSRLVRTLENVSRKTNLELCCFTYFFTKIGKSSLTIYPLCSINICSVNVRGLRHNVNELKVLCASNNL